jgi:ribulose-phosphate 3-epimerase
VLVMSVNPGFGGQSLIPESFAKLERARAYLPASVAIEVDGGVSVANVPRMIQAGANLLVAGNSVYGTGDAARSFRELTEAALGA